MRSGDRYVRRTPQRARAGCSKSARNRRAPQRPPLRAHVLAAPVEGRGYGQTARKNAISAQNPRKDVRGGGRRRGIHQEIRPAVCGQNEPIFRGIFEGEIPAFGGNRYGRKFRLRQGGGGRRKNARRNGSAQRLGIRGNQGGIPARRAAYELVAYAKGSFRGRPATFQKHRRPQLHGARNGVGRQKARAHNRLPHAQFEVEPRLQAAVRGLCRAPYPQRQAIQGRCKLRHKPHR